MAGYYDGKISKEEIKGFFMEYCSSMYARDENTIAAKEGTATDHMIIIGGKDRSQKVECGEVLR